VRYLAGNLLMQPLTRTLLPRYSLIISAVAASAFAFLIATANQPWTAIAAYAGVGLSAAMFWPPIMGWLSAGAEGARLNRKISRFNMSWSIGVILGPYIAGLLTEIDPGLALLAGAGGFAIVAVTVIAASFLMESIRNDSHRDPARNGVSAPDESTPLRFPSWVGMFGAYAVLGALAVTFPLYAREHLALREGVIGGVLLTRALASTVGFFLLGRTVAWHFRRVPIVVPIAVLVGASSILWLGSSLPLFAVIFPVAGLAIAGSYSASCIPWGGRKR
jgi:MFS family permease